VPDSQANRLTEHRKSDLKEALDCVHELQKMPTVLKSPAIWDVNVTIKSNTQLSRLVSLNHPIVIQFSDGKKLASVQLAATVKKEFVPCKDFVLLFRDEGMEKAPTFIQTMGISGH